MIQKKLLSLLLALTPILCNATKQNKTKHINTGNKPWCYYGGLAALCLVQADEFFNLLCKWKVIKIKDKSFDRINLNANRYEIEFNTNWAHTPLIKKFLICSCRNFVWYSLLKGTYTALDNKKAPLKNNSRSHQV